eukprot:sb/3475583/
MLTLIVVLTLCKSARATFVSFVFVCQLSLSRSEDWSLLFSSFGHDTADNWHPSAVSLFKIAAFKTSQRPPLSGDELPLFIQGRGRLCPSISDGTAFKTSQRPPLSGEGAAIDWHSLPPILVIKRG